MTIDKPGFYKTRDGVKVQALVIDAKIRQPVIGQFQSTDGLWFIDTWYLDGAYSRNTSDHPMDIVSVWEESAPKLKRIAWVNSSGVVALSCGTSLTEGYGDWERAPWLDQP